jgi:hypothetical protein
LPVPAPPPVPALLLVHTGSVQDADAAQVPMLTKQLVHAESRSHLQGSAEVLTQVMYVSQLPPA